MEHFAGEGSLLSMAETPSREVTTSLSFLSFLVSLNIFCPCIFHRELYHITMENKNKSVWAL